MRRDRPRWKFHPLTGYWHNTSYVLRVAERKGVRLIKQRKTKPRGAVRLKEFGIGIGVPFDREPRAFATQISYQLIGSFLRAIPKPFRYIEISLRVNEHDFIWRKPASVAVYGHAWIPLEEKR